MWKKPAGNFVGWAVPLNAPWSASTFDPYAPGSCRPCVDATSAVHVVVAGERRCDIRFSERSSTHFTGLPVTIEPTIAQT